MPIWTVLLRINVPSLGSRDVSFPNITAATLTAAIDQAKSGVIVEPIAVTQTTP